MKSLLIVAHGSRREESNREIEALAHAIEKMTDNRFDSVAYAFIQFARPLFGEMIDTLAGKGAEKIVVFPLFIAAGSHVQNDIPEEIQKAKQRHPALDIRHTGHLGRLDAVKEVIMSEADKF